MLPQFDTTIRLSDLMLIGGGIVAFARMYAKFIVLHSEQGEFNRLVTRVLGMNDPLGGGLMGDVKELRKESTRHRNWLIQMSAEHGCKIEDRT